MMKRIKLFITILLLCAAGFVGVWFIRDKMVDDENLIYTIPRTIRYSFTIKNTTNRVVKKASFKTWAPVKQNSTQKCGLVSTTHTFTTETDQIGNQMLVFNLDNFPPYGSRVISITANLMLSETPLPMSDGRFPNWLAPEQYIESNHPDLKKTAAKLKAAPLNKKAEKIFNWVTGHLSYSGYVKKDRGALYAYNHQKGDCTEYMYLFTALCRAGSIPARGVAGYECDRNNIVKSADYHNWAEFFSDGKWYVADPQKNIFMKDSSNYIAMRILTPASEGSDQLFHRFHIKGEGIEARMN